MDNTIKENAISMLEVLLNLYLKNDYCPKKHKKENALFFLQYVLYMIKNGKSPSEKLQNKWDKSIEKSIELNNIE